MKLLRWIAPLALILCLATHSPAQEVAIKTNLLNWATTTPNLGLELGIGKHSTIQVFGDVNPWEFGKNKEKHFRSWTVMPEYRYFFCEKFGGHFIGVHAFGGQYNAKGINFPLKSLFVSSSVNPVTEDTGSKGWPNLTSDENWGRHAEGWFIGAGISYGYQWMLSKHWNLEASIGIGYAYSYLKFYGRCNRVIDERKLHYVGPTRAALSFMYMF